MYVTKSCINLTKTAFAGRNRSFVPHMSMANLLKNKFAALLNVSEKEPQEKRNVQTEAAVSSSSNNTATTTEERTDKKMKLVDPLVWVDLEMTGLDVDKDAIIEIAVILTDGQLKHQIEGPEIAIHVSEEVLAGMNDWCQEHHGKSGLTERVRQSKIELAEAEQQVLAFVKQYIPEARLAQLAGNSVHVDRMFMCKYMPELMEHLHYRIVDVSTIKELVRRWYPKDYRSAPRKQLAHRALSDIKESIDELRHWKKVVFKQQK